MAEISSNYVGKQAGNYQIIEYLGSGGFADVYLGEHIYLKTQSAIKMLHIQLSKQALHNFLKEAQTIAHLEHPNIVRVFDYGVQEGSPFLVMSYAPNGTLRQHYPRGTRLPLKEIVPYVQQVASALDYAHQLKLIHRDIKPANMLIGQQQQILLSDFGLALAISGSGSPTEAGIAGTVPYMAPEQIQGKVCYASDQYALGIVTYEWICGERPFTGSFPEIASQHMLAPLPSLQVSVPDLAPEIEQVVFKALAKDPTQRFACVLDFAQALQQASQPNPLIAISTHKNKIVQLDKETTRQKSVDTKVEWGKRNTTPVTEVGVGTLNSFDQNATSLDSHTSFVPLDNANIEKTVPLPTFKVLAEHSKTYSTSAFTSQQQKRILRPLLVAVFATFLIGSACLGVGAIWYNNIHVKPDQQKTAYAVNNVQKTNHNTHNTQNGSSTKTTIRTTVVPTAGATITSDSPNSTNAPTSPTKIAGNPTNPRPGSPPTVSASQPTAKPTPDCIQASTTNIDFTSVLSAGNPGPQLLNLTNCGGNGSQNWQASVQSSGWLSLNLYRGSLTPKSSIGIQVQASSSGLQVKMYHGSITFTAGTASWQVTVTYKVVQV